nr:uncharacterized protein LOC116280245 [Vicugna pacos]
MYCCSALKLKQLPTPAAPSSPLPTQSRSPQFEAQAQAPLPRPDSGLGGRPTLSPRGAGPRGPDSVAHFPPSLPLLPGPSLPAASVRPPSAAGSIGDRRRPALPRPSPPQTPRDPGALPGTPAGPRREPSRAAAAPRRGARRALGRGNPGDAQRAPGAERGGAGAAAPTGASWALQGGESRGSSGCAPRRGPALKLAGPLARPCGPWRLGLTLLRARRAALSAAPPRGTARANAASRPSSPERAPNSMAPSSQHFFF